MIFSLLQRPLVNKGPGSSGTNCSAQPWWAGEGKLWLAMRIKRASAVITVNVVVQVECLLVVLREIPTRNYRLSSGVLDRQSRSNVASPRILSLGNDPIGPYLREAGYCED